MSEVQRYYVGKYGLVEGEALGRLSVVLAADFDNANRLFLDAAERCIASERREKELQALLTAADELNDVRAGLLRDARQHHGVMLMSDPPQDAWKFHRMNERIDAALKPAEGGSDDTTLEEDREDFKKVFVRINTKQGQSISLADMIARYEKKP